MYFAQFAIKKDLEEGTQVSTRELHEDEDAFAFIAVFENEDAFGLMKDLVVLQNEVHNLLTNLRQQARQLNNGQGELINPRDAQISSIDDVRHDTNDDVPTS